MSKLVAVHFAPVDGGPLRYCYVSNNFMEELSLSDKERYSPDTYANVFSIDGNSIVIVEDSLDKAIHTAILAMLDHFNARYEDGVREKYEDMVSVDYATWLMPLLKNMAEIASNPIQSHRSIFKGILLSIKITCEF